MTSIKPTLGNVADNTQMPDLVKHDTKLGIPAETYAADRIYDDGDLHELLKDLGKHSALKLHDYRTNKKDPNKEPWIKLLADPFYQAGLRLRYRIARPRPGRGAEVRRSKGISSFRSLSLSWLGPLQDTIVPDLHGAEPQAHRASGDRHKISAAGQGAEGRIGEHCAHRGRNKGLRRRKGERNGLLKAPPPIETPRKLQQRHSGPSQGTSPLQSPPQSTPSWPRLLTAPPASGIIMPDCGPDD